MDLHNILCCEGPRASHGQQQHLHMHRVSAQGFWMKPALQWRAANLLPKITAPSGSVMQQCANPCNCWWCSGAHWHLMILLRWQARSAGCKASAYAYWQRHTSQYDSATSLFANMSCRWIWSSLPHQAEFHWHQSRAHGRSDESVG